MAQAVFDKLVGAFPASADAVQDKSLDDGRVQPSFIKGEDEVRELLAANKACVVIQRDASCHKDLLSEHACIAVAESKGLEFASLIVLDFFTDSQRQKEWKQYVLDQVHQIIITHLSISELDRI